MNADLHHLAAAYALDALDPEERRRFEAHYPTCEICSDEVRDHRETAALLAAPTATAPSPDLRDRVLAEIARTRQIAPQVPDRVVDLADRRRSRTGMSWPSALLGAAAALLIAVIGVVALRGGPAEVPDADLVALLSAPDATVSALAGGAGSDDAGSGTVSVVWSVERGTVAVVGDGLAALDADETYALWALDEAGNAAPSLLFDPDGDGTATVVGELAVGPDDGEPSGWGVTIEPAGGSPQPTGDIIYLTS